MAGTVTEVLAQQLTLMLTLSPWQHMEDRWMMLVCVLRLGGISCGVGGVRRRRRKSVMTGSAGNEHVAEPGDVLTR